MDNLAIQKQFMLSLYPNRQLVLTKGEGVYLFDEENNKYLDLLSNYGVNILGYNNLAINQVLSEQLNKLINLHGSFGNDQRSLALQSLADCLPSGLNKVFFSNSGTESIEAALKFALFASGKTQLLAARNGYHGKTLGALGATTSHQDHYRQPFLKFVPKFDFIEFNNIASLSAITNQTAAVIIEPLQGEGGVVVGNKDFFTKLRQICDQTGTLLIMDEVQTGLGRTGRLFAYEHFGIIPDILCLGKGLAGGLPAGLTIISDSVAAKLTKGLHTNTFGGGPLVCAGISTTLKFLQDNKLPVQTSFNGLYFMSELQKLNSPLIKEVRGLGLMIAIELTAKALPYLMALQKNGIIAGPSEENVIRLLPPLIISQSEIDEAIRIFKKVLS
ncbi:MAG: aspartate aminotransferase family protein [Patescibacteria group bacterium]|jgi:acetylornithine/LysW-gamma-L-lysine aminotransferase